MPDPPRGLRYVPEALSPAEQRALEERLAELALEPVELHGVEARRRVAHFGLRYGYGARTLAPAPALPAWLEPLRERAAELAGAAPEAFVEILVTRYPPGAGIGWHRDAPVFGPVVVGFSLGAPAVMRFRRRSAGAWERHRVVLVPGSAYVLAGAARASWQHSLVAVEATRTSVTFRTLRAIGARGPRGSAPAAPQEP